MDLSQEKVIVLSEMNRDYINQQRMREDCEAKEEEKVSSILVCRET